MRTVVYSSLRTQAIFEILREYAASPSLRHIRSPEMIARTANKIVEALDQDSSVWKKWDGTRNEVLSQAIECWIPDEAMLAFLNSLPGPPLTMTDLQQRKIAMVEKEYLTAAHPSLRNGCLEIFEAERLAGTEMVAIIGRLQEYVGNQYDRVREEERAADAARLERQRLEREGRLLSSADCPWTQIKGSKVLYCRKNGRLFRLTPLPDKKWELHRVEAVSDKERGRIIGRYGSRGDASKVVAVAAFEYENR